MLRKIFYELVVSAIVDHGYVPYFFFEGACDLTRILPDSIEGSSPRAVDEFEMRPLVPDREHVASLLGVPNVGGFAVVALQSSDYEGLCAYVIITRKGEDSSVILRGVGLTGAADMEDGWGACLNIRLTSPELIQFFSQRKENSDRDFTIGAACLSSVLRASQRCAAL